MMKVNAITVLLLATGLLLSGCGGGNGNDTAYNSDYTTSTDSTSDDNTDYSNNSPSPVTPGGALVPNGARQLAAQCFQCHGTDGRSRNGIESLAGEEGEGELISEMLEMKRSTRNDIMHYQAKGYTEAQIRAIAAYIATLPGGNSND